MNLKVANLIAIQLGIFVGIMSWLAYSRLESAKPHVAAELPERVTKPAGPVAQGIKADDQNPEAVDDRTDSDEAQPIADQPAPTFHQYSAAAVQHYSDLAAQQYYQQIAPRRYASSGLQNRSVVAEAPSYAQVEQEPAVDADYSEPQTAAYVQPSQIVVYPQPQFVVFSNSRRFSNRCRPTSPVNGGHVATTHRRQDRPRRHLSGSTVLESPASPSAALRRPTNSFGVVQRENDKLPLCRPTEGFRPREHR
jgi:hypothetical protein